MEAFARRVTDVSFFAATGGFLPGSNDLRAGDYGLASYGLELLFEIGTVSRPAPGAVPVQQDSASLDWVETTVVLRDGLADTTNVYEVRRIPPLVPTDTIWLFELGLGYGQMSGFESADPNADLRGSDLSGWFASAGIQFKVAQ